MSLNRPGGPVGGTGGAPAVTGPVWLIGKPILGHKLCTADTATDRCMFGTLADTLADGWTPEQVKRANDGFAAELDHAAAMFTTKEEQRKVLTYNACLRYASFGPPDAVAGLANAAWIDAAEFSDFQKGKATDTTTALGSSDASGGAGAGADESTGVSTGALIGIAAGTVALVGVVVLLLLKRGRRPE